MSLTPYNCKMEFNPFGFDNLGSTCYFNAVIQSILSCTSFTSELIKNEETYIGNPVAEVLIELIKKALVFNTETQGSNQENQCSEISRLSPRVWRKMVKFICKKNKVNVRQFMIGQQCAGEGFNYLLDTLDSFRVIQNMFLHRYKTNIYCFDCNKCVSSVDSINNIIEVQHDLKTEQIDQFKKYDDNNLDMNKFIVKQSGYVDKFYICPDCKKDGEKYKISHLVMIPEVLVVLSKKYDSERKLDIYTEFPKVMEFTGTNDEILRYEAVSQIEHIGGKNSGHYWAISRRSDGWYSLNDNSISKSEFKPTNNTYIVFYHYM